MPNGRYLQAVLKRKLLAPFQLSLWKGRDRNTIFWVIASLCITFVLCHYSTIFLSYNESRMGYQMYDPYMANVPAVSLNWPIFILTYTTLVIGLGYALRTPEAMIRTSLSISTLLALRIVAMYFVPLEPPHGIIPLVDPFLSSSFYDGKVLVKDLFFSGHTSSIAILALLVQHKTLSRALWVMSIIVGSMLIIQHVHYLIDVFAAFFFSYLAYKSGDRLHKALPIYSRYISRLFTLSKRSIAGYLG